MVEYKMGEAWDESVVEQVHPQPDVPLVEQPVVIPSHFLAAVADRDDQPNSAAIPAARARIQGQG
jgi:hypothetical protein